jgi:ActR/RegA family two-component response regulator
MKKILWIDDDEKLIDNSAPIFLKNGFYILKATTTSRALTILREEKLDGVLLDVRLRGGESGLELLREIRHHYPTLKIAIFTGYPEYDDHVLAEAIGASAYLAKLKKSIPLDMEKQHRFFQALSQIFSESQERSSSITTPKATGISSLWSNGLFFLILFIVVIVAVGVLSKNVSPWVLPITLIAGVLMLIIVGAFVLRTQGDAGLSQRNFVTLLLETLKRVPLLKQQSEELHREKKDEK